MGQGQSSANEGGAGTEALAKTDYYELLGVERQATEDEIKKAYRRKALELHPDRNYEHVEEATKLFAAVQSAYEVLSDPQERAWYDSHRDVLLRGGEAGGAEGEQYSYNIRMTTTEEVLKLMMKFNGRLNFNDSSDGFYGGLQDFFQKLAKEEEVACQWEGVDNMDYPVFGHKKDDFDDVVKPFYAVWNGFSTRKTYSWKDAYRLSDAPERRVRRMMEKENRRLREEGIREFNDAVRSLVAFVRKRDPRYQENLQSEAQRQKSLRDTAAAQAARARAANKAQLDKAVVPDWAKSEEVEADPFSEEEESEEEQIECVVCNKTFKSEKQYQVHEKSKKHIKLLKQLRRELKDEDPLVEENTVQQDGQEPPKAALTPETVPVAGPNMSVNGDGKPSNESESDPASEPELQQESVNQEAAALPASQQSSSELASDDDEDDDYASRDKVASRIVEDLTLGSKNDKATASPLPALSEVGSDSPSSAPATPKLGKAKQKRAKKAAQQAGREGETKATISTCAVCGEMFPSKTKLFNHVRDEGHTAPKTVLSTQPTTGIKSKKGQKK